MKRLFIASNIIPASVKKKENGFEITEAEGTTVYDLKRFRENFDIKWIGRTGLENHVFVEQEKVQLSLRLEEFSSIPIFPDLSVVQGAIRGFSKNTLWPLFHYFPQNATYNNEHWSAYVLLNQMYADKLCDLASDDDIIWVHDYHLLLVPQMIKNKKPNVSIGLFIHIPFPSFEIFRLLPWREEIMDGMLSADLIGFHVYDYVRHLLSCVRRIKGYDTIFNRIAIGEKTMIVDVFPKGIQFEKFTEEVRSLNAQDKSGKSKFQGQIIKKFAKEKDMKVILSIDPLDYTKGIPHRLLAFELFLQEYPEYLEKVSLVLLALPTGESSKSYNSIKKKVDELVGSINGLFGTISWTPIIYLNQKFSKTELIDIYAYSDIALILPLRDGMNMVAKEFIASRLEGKGVLILSELAGSSKELHEALLVNPNNLYEIAAAIKEAIEMPACEQIRRNDVMTERIRRYTIEKWASEFIKSIESVKQLQETNLTKKITEARIDHIVSEYKKTASRILFLDYDGTLSWFRKNPEDARPDDELKSVLSKLTSDPKNTVVIISGRDKETLGRWFKDNDSMHFIAEHGVWIQSQMKNGIW